MKARPTMTDAELEAWVADMRTRAPLTPMLDAFSRHTHGTRSTYVAGCRCQSCRVAVRGHR